MNNSLVLTQPVTIAGPDYWGRKAEITFYPSASPGWWWDFIPHQSVKITPSIIEKRKIRTRLAFHEKNLEIFEHFGIIRWFGLHDVRIKSDKWPPHFGCAHLLWEKLKPFCKENPSSPVKWHTVDRLVRWNYPELRGGEMGFTEILPSDKPVLELEIAYGYPPLGSKDMHFSIPDTETLEKICLFPSQGVFRSMYHLGKLASFFGWPHLHKSVWPNHYPSEEVMRRFVLHRTADLLGALCLLCKDGGLFAGKVISHYSGHEADLHVVKKAWELLVPL